MSTSTPAMPRAITPAGLAQKVGRGRYQRTRFVDLLNRELLAVASGEVSNLAVFAPPRHGKSRLLTEVFAAWYLGTFPTRKVIVASHSASLASTFGMNVRDMLAEFGPGTFGVSVREDRRAADNWSLTDGGGMLSIGVGGSLVGHGADLFILDDIIADAASALSETVRNSTVDWYESTAETRINSGGSQVFTMQRWHQDDPAARIVYSNPENWRIVSLPAIADHDPSKGESDPLGREPGEPLWPEKWPIPRLREMQRRKAFWFAAQYQQRPVPRGGGMIQVDWIEGNAVHYVPREADGRVRFWDLAATEGDGDYTVGVLMSRKGDQFYVEDVVRGQWGSTNRDRVIATTCGDDNRRFPFGVVTWGERQPSGAGKDAAEAFERMLAPYAAHSQAPKGDKVLRADGLASAFGRGDVHVRKGHEKGKKFDWYDDLVAELSSFPSGKHDDIVDACSGAYNVLFQADAQVSDYASSDESDADLVAGGAYG